MEDPKERFLRLVDESFDRHSLAVEKWGPHESPEFTCCRIAEEAGELVKAATSGSEKRLRREAMDEETKDILAMILRLFTEWPEGREDQ